MVCPSTVTLALETLWINARMEICIQVHTSTSKHVICFHVYLFACLHVYLLSGQMHCLSHFGHGFLCNDPRTFSSIIQYIRDIIRLGCKLSALGSERFKMLVQVFCKKYLTVHAANARPAAFDVDHINLFRGREKLVHREYI